MKHISTFLVGITILGSSLVMFAAPVQWSSGDGGNDHWYEPIAVADPGISWTDAQDAAAARGGYLATLLSEAENDFVFALVNDDSYWHPNKGGPWIGGYQLPDADEPDQGWSWISGEPWTYDNWAAGQPDEWMGRNQDFLHYHSRTGGPVWDDAQDDNGLYGYVVEYIPEPFTLILIAVGIVAIPRRRKTTMSPCSYNKSDSPE